MSDQLCGYCMTDSRFAPQIFCNKEKGHDGSHAFTMVVREGSTLAEPAASETDLERVTRLLHDLHLVAAHQTDPQAVRQREALAAEFAQLRAERDGEWVDAIEDHLRFGVMPPETLENTVRQLPIWLEEHDGQLRAECGQEADALIEEALKQAYKFVGDDMAGENPPRPTVASVRAAQKAGGK